jgi:hypothetical protein
LTSWKSFRENTVRRIVQVLHSSIVKSLRKSYYIELLICQVSIRKDLSSMYLKKIFRAGEYCVVGVGE